MGGAGAQAENTDGFRKGRRQESPPFLVKTWQLVTDEATNELVSWSEEGTPTQPNQPKQSTNQPALCQGYDSMCKLDLPRPRLSCLVL